MRVKELIFISFSFPACNFKNKCKAYCIQAKGQIYVCMYVCMYVCNLICAWGFMSSLYHEWL